MVGRELSAVFPKRAVRLDPGTDVVALEVEGLTHRATGIDGVSFSVRAGEILGLAGLVGSGRTQLAEILFGLTPADAGTIRVHGTPVRLTTPRAAIDAGIAYVPEDRRQHGVVLEMSVAANTSLATLSAVSSRGLIDRGREVALAERYVSQFRIMTPRSTS
jgi:rhamnose transport system ATP-binding protein